MTRIPCSALLLTGGESRRMGTDKGRLLLGGQLLWQRQWETLLAVEPVEAYIAGSRGLFPGCEVLPDERLGLGPLSGLVSGLRRMRESWLVVLAVDLPLITGDLLLRLLAHAEASGRGVLPARGSGVEPLAAVYPRAARIPAEEALAADRRALTPFTEALEAAALMSRWPVPAEEERLFANTNTPEEWAAFTGGPALSRSARPASSGRSLRRTRPEPDHDDSPGRG